VSEPAQQFEPDPFLDWRGEPWTPAPLDLGWRLSFDLMADRTGRVCRHVEDIKPRGYPRRPSFTVHIEYRR